MKTKLVYVVVSSLSDYYLEQAWVSMWSAKHYNPDVEIVMVTDKETQTATKTQERSGFLKIVNDFIVVDFDVGISNLERSRWLKTNLRKLVQGDFLYVDSDTVVTGSLSEIDEWTSPLGMVLDLHMETATFPATINAWVKKLLDYEFQTPNYHYFNGGIIYAKDCKETHEFFKKWHENWKITKSRGELFDQPSLNKVNDELGGKAITVLSGIYNCQVFFSIRYLQKAKIIHFARALVYGRKSSSFSPFQKNEIFQKVRTECGIGKEVYDKILNCKSEFDVPSAPVDMDEFIFLKSLPCRALKKIYVQKPNLFQLLERIMYRIKKLKL